MPTTIEILFKAVTTQAQAGLKGFNSALNQTIQGLTGFSLSGLGVAAALSGVAVAVKKAVAEYSAYVESIDKASQRMGIAVEDYSRLVEAADDARVSQEGLERALTMMQQKGLDPTVEGLKAVADKFVSIQDPSDRAAYMMDVYGKSWKEIEPLIRNGGKAIDEAMAAIDDGLVITKENVDANKEYYQALDELNDSIKAVGNEGLKDLMPGLIDAAKFLQKAADAAIILMQWNEKLNGSFQEASRQMVKTNGTYEQYNAMLLNVAIATHKLSENQRQNSEITRINSEDQLSLVAIMGGLTESQFLAAQAALQYSNELHSLQAMASDTTALEATKGALENTSGAASAGEAALSGYNSALSNVGALNDQIRTAQENLTAAQKEWNDNVMGKSVGLLDEGKLGQEKYQAALHAGDEIFGTSYLLQDNLNRALEDAAKKYEETGNLENYKEALVKIKDQFQPLDEKIKNATQTLKDLETQALKMDGMVIDMLINIQQQGGVTLPPGANAPVPSVPSGGGTSPTPGGGGGTVNPVNRPTPQGMNVTIQVNSAVDASRVAAQVAQAIQRRQ